MIQPMDTKFNTEEKLAEFEMIDAQEDAAANEAAAEIEAEMFYDDADIQETASEIEAECIFEDEQVNESLVDEIVQEFAV